VLSPFDRAFDAERFGLGGIDAGGSAGWFPLDSARASGFIPYQADFTQQGLLYTAMGKDAEVASRPTALPMQTRINKRKPTLFLDGDRMITPEDRLLQPRYDIEPFDRERLTPLSWRGVNRQVESQGIQRRADSIQAFMSKYLQSTDVFDVLIDDDRAGEAADLVGIRIADAELIVTLVHCKYSSRPDAGARLIDLYELCGQAVRGAKWRQQGTQPLLRHLDRRAQDYAKRTSKLLYEVGGHHSGCP